MKYRYIGKENNVMRKGDIWEPSNGGKGYVNYIAELLDREVRLFMSLPSYMVEQYPEDFEPFEDRLDVRIKDALEFLEDTYTSQSAVKVMKHIRQVLEEWEDDNVDEHISNPRGE